MSFCFHALRMKSFLFAHAHGKHAGSLRTEVSRLFEEKTQTPYRMILKMDVGVIRNVLRLAPLCESPIGLALTNLQVGLNSDTTCPEL